jgi:hypothetical protein
MLYPNPGLAAILGQGTEQAAEVFNLLKCISGHELRGEGRVYGGGLNKIEPSELARISAASFLERWPQLDSAVHRQKELFGSWNQAQWMVFCTLDTTDEAETFIPKPA